MAKEALLEIIISVDGIKHIRIISETLKDQATGAELYLCLLNIIAQIDNIVKSQFKLHNRLQ